jgi:hypothetical protein
MISFALFLEFNRTHKGTSRGSRYTGSRTDIGRHHLHTTRQLQPGTSCASSITTIDCRHRCRHRRRLPHRLPLHPAENNIPLLSLHGHPSTVTFSPALARESPSCCLPVPAILSTSPALPTRTVRSPPVSHLRVVRQSLTPAPKSLGQPLVPLAPPRPKSLLQSSRRHGAKARGRRGIRSGL